jgi:hypothetical protein
LLDKEFLYEALKESASVGIQSFSNACIHVSSGEKQDLQKWKELQIRLEKERAKRVLLARVGFDEKVFADDIESKLFICSASTH